MCGGLTNYVIIKEIGQGAAGTVSLVQRKSDNKEFALKKINLSKLEENEKINAAN